jgi:peptide/nickel transport system permease protein
VSEQRTKKKKKRNLLLLAGAALTLTVLLFTFVGAFYTPNDPEAMNAAEKLLPPTLNHLFGTDKFGRDIFSRVMKGTLSTVSTALLTVLAGGGIGILAGAVTGYFGGKADAVLTRLGDTVTAFPAVLTALLVVSLLGPGGWQVAIALAIAFIPSFMRVSRAAFAGQRRLPYVISARLQGASHAGVMLRHILPNTLPSLLPALTIGFSNAVLAEAGMSYLGIGVTPPDASLGYMLSEAQGMLALAPWYAVSCGAVLLLAVLGVGLLGEGLKDA